MSKINNLSSKNKVVLGVIGLVIVALITGTVIMMNMNKKSEQWKPKVDTVTFEYGETKTLNESKFITNNEDEISFVKFDIEIPTEKVKTDEKEVDTFKVGTYKGYLVVQDKDNVQSKHAITVIVKDTIAPEFVDFKKEIKIAVGTDNIKLENYFMAEDLSDVTISVKGDVDFKTEGTYDITVTATDSHGNKTDEQSSVVIIISKEDADKDGVTEIVSQTDENGNIIGATDEQIQNNTNMQTGSSQSSNENNNTGSTGNGTGGTENGSGQGSQGGSNNTGVGTGENNNDSNNGSQTTECRPDYCPNGYLKPTPNKGSAGALGERPDGLLGAIQESDGSWFEFYLSETQAKARGDDLKVRGLIRGYSYGTGSQGIYCSFYLK